MNTLLHLTPKVSEKTYAMSQGGLYVFVVPKAATKQHVAEAVKQQFSVDVVSVNSVVHKGKKVRFYRSGKFEKGIRSDTKKMYVRLAKGQSIPIFAAEEAEAKSETKSKKGSK